MKKITKVVSWLASSLLLIFFSATPAKAVFFQSGDTVILTAGKIINEAALVTGSSLTIDSDINGDLYCLGRDVVVNGNIKGDIACAGQSIKIYGTVDGNIRSIAQTIEVSGMIYRNLTVVSQRLILGPKSNIKGDIFFGVQNVELNGIMGRDLAGAGEAITITGSLLRNALIMGSNLTVIETGKVGGNLDYYMEKSATASINEKNIKGSITRYDIETSQRQEAEKEVVKATSAALFIKFLMCILSYAILGWALIYFDRKNVEKRLSLITQKPLVMGLIGLAVLVLAPIVLILLMVTMVGMPLAFVILFVYITVLITASLYPSMIYGRLFTEKLLKKQKTDLVWQMVLGVIILGTVSYIPVVGWVIALTSFCLGLGAFTTSLSPEK